MTFDLNETRRRAEADAQQRLAKLPSDIRAIVERLPFGARWTLAATIGEVQTKRDVYTTGIAVGMVSAASVREEITHEQMETLTLYVASFCPDRLITR